MIVFNSRQAHGTEGPDHFHGTGRGRPGRRGNAIFARLKRLTRALSAAEFAIDEKPLEVLDVARAAPRAQGERVAGEPATRANGETAPLAPPRKDLVSSLSEVLAEHGRLEKLAKEIKPAGAHDDEFGRFAREVTPFIDGFDQVVAMAREYEGNEEIADWLKVVESLYDRLVRNFENFDLKIIDCVGQEVDFNMHDVIEYRRTKDHPHNTVVDVIRKGIVFRGRILRDAKVVVACNEDEEA